MESGTRITVVCLALGWDFDRVIPAHGGILETDGKTAFKSDYAWFLGHAP